MDETFKTRLTALLAANPRICDNGCALVVRQKVSPMRYILAPKTDTYTPCESDISRIYRLTLYIKENLGNPPTTNRGRMLVGSYGWKHTLEKLPWTEEPNTYVSNTEGMVAMMLCGYEPRWSKDPQSPNCVFSISRKVGRPLTMEASRRFNERLHNRPPPPPSPY
jgi:hypothetical protein